MSESLESGLGASKTQRKLLIAAFVVVLVPPAATLFLVNRIAQKVQTDREIERCSTYVTLRVLRQFAGRLNLNQRAIALPDIRGLECQRILATPITESFDDERGSRGTRPTGGSDTTTEDPSAGSDPTPDPVDSGTGGGGPPSPPVDESPPESPAPEPSPSDQPSCVDTPIGCVPTPTLPIGAVGLGGLLFAGWRLTHRH